VDNEELMSMLPSEEDIRFYEEHGWFIPDKVFTEDQIMDGLYGVERFYVGERDRHLPITRGYLNWTPEDGDVLRVNDYVSLQIDEIAELIATDVFSAIAATLARTSSIRLFHDQLIYKPPTAEGRSTVGWHSDRAYWKTCTSDNMITAWTPFAETTFEGGTLMYLDRSHRWPNVANMATFNEQNHESVEEAYARAGFDVQPVPVILKPGQVSFHHCNLIHGSLPNSGDAPRIALATHFQDASNRYTPAVDKRGNPIVHVNDILCRPDQSGVPDYSDPDICPLLWSAETTGATP
jgi:hypothetical protein